VQEVLSSLPPPVRAALQQADAAGRGELSPAARGELVPKSCPHCGALASAGAAVAAGAAAGAPAAMAAGGAVVAVLRCSGCGARWLNVSQDKLQLGTTVLLERQKQQPLGSLGGASSGGGGGGGGGGAAAGGGGSDTAAVTWHPVKRTAVAVHEGGRGLGGNAADIGSSSNGGSSSSGGSDGSSSTRELRGQESAWPPAAAQASGGGSHSESGAALADADAEGSRAAATQSLHMWPVVTERDVYDVIHEATGIPTEHLGENAACQLASLAAQLSEEVLGQPEAVAAAAAALQVARLGLQPEASAAAAGRPAASLLLVGPDGVGKSTLARAVGGALLPAEPAARLALAMGDYSERHSTARLVGAPPGWVEGAHYTIQAMGMGCLGCPQNRRLPNPWHSRLGWGDVCCHHERLCAAPYTPIQGA
jgi:hypothetical protein